MKNVKIKKLKFGGAPLVAGIIESPISAMRLISFVNRGVGMFEVRADLFNKPIGRIIQYIEATRKVVSAPFIGTVRETKFNAAERVEWYAALAECVDIIDIELGMPEWRKAVDRAGKAAVMVSEHNFNATPDIKGLHDIVKRSLDQGAEIVKIAVMANSAADVTRLFKFTEDCETPLVSISMGSAGMISRVAAPLFGSLFTYGYLGKKPLVPGQLSALYLAKTIENLFPVLPPLI